jgi:hypothetical protein
MECLGIFWDLFNLDYGVESSCQLRRVKEVSAFWGR